jgi:hypothetical protein
MSNATRYTLHSAAPDRPRGRRVVLHLGAKRYFTVNDTGPISSTQRSRCEDAR